MPRQLTFDLPARPALGREAFYVSPANAAAVALIEGWADWPQARLVLSGPKGAGKTHLAHVWAALAGASIIEAASDAEVPDGPLAVENVDRIARDRAAQERLFHLYNQFGRPLLLTGTGAPGHWGLTLPDLASRVMQPLSVSLEAPDDQLLHAVAIKLFADRQLIVAPGVITYALTRLDRSFAALEAFVTAADTLSLQEGRAVTRGLAARALTLSET